MKINKILLVSMVFALSPAGAYSEERISVKQLNEAVSGAELPAAPAAVSSRLKSQGADLTAEYRALYADLDFSSDAAVFEKIKDYNCIMIEGGPNMFELSKNHVDYYLSFIAPKTGGHS